MTLPGEDFMELPWQDSTQNLNSLKIFWTWWIAFHRIKISARKWTTCTSLIEIQPTWDFLHENTPGALRSWIVFSHWFAFCSFHESKTFLLHQVLVFPKQLLRLWSYTWFPSRQESRMLLRFGMQSGRNSKAINFKLFYLLPFLRNWLSESKGR